MRRRKAPDACRITPALVKMACDASEIMLPTTGIAADTTPFAAFSVSSSVAPASIPVSVR